MNIILDLWKCQNRHIDVDSEGAIVQLPGKQLSSVILIKLQDLTVLKFKHRNLLLFAIRFVYLLVWPVSAVHSEVTSLVDSNAAAVIACELVREAGGQGQGSFGSCKNISNLRTIVKWASNGLAVFTSQGHLLFQYIADIRHDIKKRSRGKVTEFISLKCSVGYTNVSFEQWYSGLRS